MQRFVAVLTFVLIGGGAMGYGLHLWRGYEAIQKKSHDHAAVIVTPVIDDESVSDTGYIFQVRRENYIGEGFSTMDWFIAVPATGDRLGCGYLFGSPDFKVGDGVTIIHNVKSLDGSKVGYVIGLHGSQKSKVAKVDCGDLDLAALESGD